MTTRAGGVALSVGSGLVRALSDKENFVRTMLDGPVPIGLSRVDDGRWVRVNDGFLQLCGRPMGDVVGATPELWADPSAAARVLRAIRRGARVEGFDLLVRRPDGVDRPTRATIEPIKFAGEDCVVWTLVDLTARRDAEHRQRVAEAEVERRGRLLGALSAAQRAYLDGARLVDALDPLLAEVLALTGSRLGGVFDTDDGDGDLWLRSRALSLPADEPRAAELLARHRAEGLLVPPGSALPWHVVRAGIVLRSDGMTRRPRLLGEPLSDSLLASFLGVPIRGPGGAVIGCLVLGDRPGGYDDRVLEGLGPALGVCGSLLHADRAATSSHRATAALRDSEDRFQLLVEGVRGCALVLLDPFGCVSSWNAGALQITGLASSDVIGCHVSRLYPLAAQQAGAPDRELAEAEEHGRAEVEGLRVHADGHEFMAHVTLTVLRDDDGRLRGFAQLTRDITREHELARLKDELISVVSHELRTPISAIQGALGLLAGGVMGPLGDEVLDLVGLARSNCDRLGRLVNDMLLTSKLEAGRFELHRRQVSLAAIATRTLDALRPVAAPGAVQLRTELVDDTPCWADEDRLVQVLTNLVSNAIKFSPPGGEVSVHVSSVGDGRQRVEVRDHGPGIPADRLKLLFGKFSQLDASDRRAQAGTGLGLWIAKALIEAHGGTIGVESRMGEGTTFWFELVRPEVESCAA